VGDGVLARFFAAQCEAYGYSPADLTVLGGKKPTRIADPFRLDTLSNRRLGKWFAEHFNDIYTGVGDHLRGIHYVLSAGGQRLKPNKIPYLNNFPNWRWLIEKCAKVARWLGYVDWWRIPDARNEDPYLYRPPRAGKAKAVLPALPVPEAIDVTPAPVLEGFTADQEFTLADFSEKSSVAGLLREISEQKHINYYPASGDMVDRRIYEMARDAYADGRKLIVFTVCDCDPSGHAMPRAIGRKLQAHAVATFPNLRFEVVRAGLTPAQAKAMHLPDSPLKETEKRAEAWRAAFDIGQVELDAALALQPDRFREAIEAEIELYFDDKLAKEVETRKGAWEAEARAAVLARLYPLEMAWLQRRHDAACAEIRAVKAYREMLVERIKLPDLPEPPKPDMAGKAERRHPLIDSDWGFVKGTLALIADRGYEGADDVDDVDDIDDAGEEEEEDEIDE
jgi:hypothetical protein